MPGGINDQLYDDGSSNSTADDDVSGEFWRDDDDNDATRAKAEAEAEAEEKVKRK